MGTSEGSYKVMNKNFAVYKSPYSGAFDLLDTMYIPRPCATNSVNVTQIPLTYFYGQKQNTFDLVKSGYSNILSKMSPEKEFVFQNGSDTKLFAWLGTSNSSSTVNNKTNLFVQTNDESLVGTQRLAIRGCDSLNNLHEVNVYVNGKPPTHTIN